MGNPDLDFEIRISHLAIEREIRFRISPSRNPSSGQISISESKSGFHGFPPYRSIGKSETERICKTDLVNRGLFLLIMRARARPLFLRTDSFKSLFGFPKRTVNRKSKHRFLSVDIVFGFRVLLQIRNPDFKI